MPNAAMKETNKTPVADNPTADALVADCRAALAAYATDHPVQGALRDRFIAHLTDRGDGWSRTCPGAHLTASAIIVSPDADQVLLVQHRKLGRWLQTGGHIESSDPTLAGAALREATEESGAAGLQILPGVLHLDRHEVPCGPQRPTYHLDVRYLIVADPTLSLRPGGEVSRWFPAAALPTDETSVTVLVELARQWLN